MRSAAKSNAVDTGLLVIRIGLGLGLLYFHGWGKLMAGPERWAGVGDAMQYLGIAFGLTFFGLCAALAESAGGLALAAGLLTRPAAALVAFTMFVAFLAHVVPGQGNAGHAFKNFFVAVGLFITGPGRYSLDAWLARRRR
jgi:putative oxidoreductase